MATNEQAPESIDIDLRNPATAAFLAWLIPGAGHLYQRRYAKAAIFAVCVLGCYFFGLSIGDGHVVYASWTREDPRWQFVFQAGVGLPAMPALIQNRRAAQIPPQGQLFAPPRGFEAKSHDELANWHLKLGSKFELGTLYTMIAGLLNILAIYDAYGGPLVPAPADERPKRDPDAGQPDSEPGTN